ncbi:unnamed protein product [Chrysodeixis includens]|uniref:Uncharacterized protein n=1 Tax=Chrysodeixis includens TaxID=689277 RepID=A0A9P0FSC7_CHRIL|nr:unnamed protein product [Chrysodeixis includens]
MQKLIVVLLVAFLCTVLCQPLDIQNDDKPEEVQHHSLWRRFVNPMFAFGGAASGGVSRMRTKRGTEAECERLALCKLHARSQHSFLAAFQLYFVNKENARLWDHHAHTMADCQERFGDCYDE